MLGATPTMPGRRSPSPEDRTVWRNVTRSISFERAMLSTSGMAFIANLP